MMAVNLDTRCVIDWLFLVGDVRLTIATVADLHERFRCSGEVAMMKPGCISTETVIGRVGVKGGKVGGEDIQHILTIARDRAMPWCGLTWSFPEGSGPTSAGRRAADGRHEIVPADTGVVIIAWTITMS